MPNPFEQRATEYLRDDEAFLAVVTPEPLAAFFQKPAEEGRLYDRLAVIVGTPGSGKTTLARLFEYSTLSTLLAKRAITAYKPLVDMLTACGAIQDGRATIVGTRLPMESEYRELWDLRYSPEVKHGLFTALVQARAVLTWLRKLEAAGVATENVQIVPRLGSLAALTAIGGRTGPAVFARARAVEGAIYKITAALVPPPIGEVDQDATAAYRPFDVIDVLRIGAGRGVLELRPLAILDDAHTLHSDQFAFVCGWLTRRELRVARWVLTRLDALSPQDALAERPGRNSVAGFDREREVTRIPMQDQRRRAQQRVSFRKMATDMASRYLSQMPVFSRRRLTNLSDLLATEPEPITDARVAQLSERVNKAQQRHGISEGRFTAFASQVRRYLRNKSDAHREMELAMLSILMERYVKRTKGRSLFGDTVDPDPQRPLKVDASVADGARVHLLHEFSRPYFFGINMLCDASSENAEQFLRLSARLVAQVETRLIRTRGSATLSSKEQHRLLVERAGELLESWDFPESRLVRRLCDRIARECRTKSLEGNASLGGGPNAIGIPQAEFDTIVKSDECVGRVLKFGVAYNAFVLLPRHKTKNRTWCVIELGGVLLIHYGLTLKRGGFLECRGGDLTRFLDGRADG